MRILGIFRRAAAAFLLSGRLGSDLSAAGPVLPHPILFVTQVPEPADFTTITSTFGNHLGNLDSVPRGGDLWIRYPDGTLKNLTLAAGFGASGAQAATAIAVREPAVHWDGDRAVFSLVLGAPTRQYEVTEYFWQLYEIRNFLDPAATPVITRVPGQPVSYNNISPTYGTDDRILFTSDRPRSGERHLWPQRDEYEEAPTVTGLWSLDPASGDLFQLNHSPSGAFSPGVDSFGRVVFVRWDHLQRDQQADGDALTGGQNYGTFNYSSEASDALILTNNCAEIFPEPRQTAGGVNGHTFNQFFPWTIREDGTGEETLNHLGRHELGGSYRSAARNDDPNLGELYYFGNKPNTNIVDNFLQIRESSTKPGQFYGIDAPEFGTHAAGSIVALNAPLDRNADSCTLEYVTASRLTATQTGAAQPLGLYRSPLPLSDGRLAAVFTRETSADANVGTASAPVSRYDFHLILLKKSGDSWIPDLPLTDALTASVEWWSPDERRQFQGRLWELDPVEVRSRPRPARVVAELESPEQSVFLAEGVEPSALQRFLRERNLALIVGRDVTTRDAADFQQPFNLRAPGGHQTVGKAGKIYDVAHLQLFQGDLVRGLGIRNAGDAPVPGRRVLARTLHDSIEFNPPNSTGPAGSVGLASDGSFASLVPSRRAVSWQLTSPDGGPVVHERYWLTFQPGEIRACGSCHGVNTHDQAGQPPPTNPPEALRGFLRFWKNQTGYARLNVERSGTDLTVSVSAGSERTNVVEASIDLRNWTTVTTHPPNSTGHYLLHQQLSDDEPTRFFRVQIH